MGTVLRQPLTMRRAINRTMGRCSHGLFRLRREQITWSRRKYRFRQIARRLCSTPPVECSAREPLEVVHRFAERPRNRQQGAVGRFSDGRQAWK
jgi:hypothetical protein